MSELLNNFYDQNKCKYTKFYEINNSKIIEKFSINSNSGEEEIDEQGIDEQGIDEQGIDEQEIDEQGIDEQGIDEQGIDEQGTVYSTTVLPKVGEILLSENVVMKEKETSLAREIEELRIREIEESSVKEIDKYKEIISERKIEEASILYEASRNSVVPILTYPATSISIATNLISANSKITISQLHNAIDQINNLLINNQSITPSLYNSLILGLENIIMLSYKFDFNKNQLISESIKSTIIVQLLQGISYIVIPNYKPLYNQLLKFLNITSPNISYQFNNLATTIIDNINDYDNKNTFNDNDNKGALLQLLSNVIYNDHSIPALFISILLNLLISQLEKINKNKSIDIKLQMIPLMGTINQLSISNKLIPILTIKEIIKIYIQNMELNYKEISTQLNNLLIINPSRGEIIINTETLIPDNVKMSSSSIATLIIPKNSNINVTEFASSLDELKLLLNNNQNINSELYKILLSGLINIIDPTIFGSFDDLKNPLESLTPFVIIQLLHIFSYKLRSDYNKFYNKLYNQLLNFLNINIPSVKTEFIDLVNLIMETNTDSDSESESVLNINKEASLLQILSVILNNKQNIPYIIMGMMFDIKILLDLSLKGNEYNNTNDVDKSLFCTQEKMQLLQTQIVNNGDSNKLIPILLFKEFLECFVGLIKPKYSEIYSQIDKLIFNNPSITYAYVSFNIPKTTKSTEILESTETTKSTKNFFTLPIIIGISVIVLIVLIILVILKIMKII
jgi:hypothetical protein